MFVQQGTYHTTLQEEEEVAWCRMVLKISYRPS